MERFPENVPVSLQDFQNSGWKTIIEPIIWKGNGTAWEALSKPASQAIKDGRHSEGKALWIIADACSMMLRPESTNEPFGPLMVMDGNRTAVASDFKEDEIKFLAEIVDHIDEPWLSARIADILWLVVRPRNPRYALGAIDAYRQSPINVETWIRGGKECWARAIRLALLLKDGSGTRAKEIEETLLQALMATTVDDGFLPLWIVIMLREGGLGRERASEVATKLDSLAAAVEEKGEFRQSREFLEEASIWYTRIGQKEIAISVSVRAAETWVKEANSRAELMVKSNFLEKAIQKYRTIPKVFRSQYQIESKLADLYSRMNEASQESLSHLKVYSSPEINISEIVMNSRKAVQGKSTAEALEALANIYSGAKVKSIREFVESSLQEHPFMALISSTHYSRDGRVVAKRPGITPHDIKSAESEQTILAEMVRHYAMEVGMYVQACIWPALQAVQLEHRLGEGDFTGMAAQSPIVPPGREQFFGKALFAGYDRDFVTALHIIVPQMENLVRWHLKSRGVKTTTMDAHGIENEIGLSSLIDIAEVELIFGKDFAFEIRALFCDAFGPNLRNELAHGLLEFQSCESANAIYAWWITLRIVFNTFWNERNKNLGQQLSPDDNQQEQQAEGNDG